MSENTRVEAKGKLYDNLKIYDDHLMKASKEADEQ